MHGASAVESPLSTLKVAREEVGHRLPTADWMVILRRAFGSAGPPDVSDLDLKHFARRLCSLSAAVIPFLLPFVSDLLKHLDDDEVYEVKIIKMISTGLYEDFGARLGSRS